MSLAAVNKNRRKEKGAVSIGSARLAFRARRVLGSRAGFTLTEALATVIIVGLVTAILASGVALATRQYTQSMVNSEAQMLYSSLQKILDTELRYTGAITESDDKSRVTGFESKHYKAREVAEGSGSSFVATENLCTILEGADGVAIQSPDQPGMLAMTSGFDTATAVYSPLLGSGAYNYGLKASIPSIVYDQNKGCFIINLVISRSDNPGTAVVDETFTVMAMNLYTNKNSGGSSSGNGSGTGETTSGWHSPTEAEKGEVKNSTEVTFAQDVRLDAGTIVRFTLPDGKTVDDGTEIKLFLFPSPNHNGTLKKVIVVRFTNNVAEVVLPNETSNGSLNLSFVLDAAGIEETDIIATVVG